MEVFKPVIKELIQFYYNNMENGAGGYCHVALDDGNLSEIDLWHCQELCKEKDDGLGYLIATVLRYFTEDDRERMYNEGWWDITPKPPDHIFHPAENST